MFLWPIEAFLIISGTVSLICVFFNKDSRKYYTLYTAASWGMVIISYSIWESTIWYIEAADTIKDMSVFTVDVLFVSLLFSIVINIGCIFFHKEKRKMHILLSLGSVFLLCVLVGILLMSEHYFFSEGYFWLRMYEFIILFPFPL